jgi:predicted class III extradiol MEMO1 family dioxygenase
MTNEEIPFIGSEGFYHMDEEELKIWDNTLMDGLEEIEVDEVIDKIRNYYNTSCDINGRPPSKLDFNDFLNTVK